MFFSPQRQRGRFQADCPICSTSSVLNCIYYILRIRCYIPSPGVGYIKYVRNSIFYPVMSEAIHILLATISINISVVLIVFIVVIETLHGGSCTRI